MRRTFFHFLAVLALLGSLCSAAPITIKELEFLVRQRTPEAEIMQDVAARKLITPLDAAGEKQLAASGASPGLLAQLKSGNFSLSPEQAQAEMQRQAATQQRLAQQLQDAQAQSLNQPNAEIANRPREHGTVQRWLKDKLVHQEGGHLLPLENSKIGGTRVFAFYASAAWCGPCKLFTPKFVAAYRALKDKYPELETVFVSQDRDEFNMTEYMRSFQMPWPAVKYHQLPSELAGFFGGSIPWLVLVGEDGKPITQNGIDKKYIDPNQTLSLLDNLLSQRRAKGI